MARVVNSTNAGRSSAKTSPKKNVKSTPVSSPKKTIKAAPVNTKPNTPAKSKAKTPQKFHTGNFTGMFSMSGKTKVKSADNETVLALTKIYPVSAAKVMFFLSLAVGVIFVVAITLFWLILDTSGIVFQLSQAIVGSGTGIDLSGSFTVGKVFVICLVLACINTVLWTVLGVIIAQIYNLVAKLSGGLKLKFSKS